MKIGNFGNANEAPAQSLNERIARLGEDFDNGEGNEDPEPMSEDEEDQLLADPNRQIAEPPQPEHRNEPEAQRAPEPEARPAPALVPEAPQRNAFDPGFLDLRQLDEDERIATRAQEKDMLEAVIDAREEETHRRLTNGVRPGEFFELFASLGWVKKTRNNARCAEFLEHLRKWCANMRDVDVGLTALPENVRY